jgi:uncharacterized protein (DUF2062 family)
MLAPPDPHHRDARRDALDTRLYAALVYLGVACCFALAVASVVSAAFAIALGQPWLFAPLAVTVFFAIAELGRIRRLTAGAGSRPLPPC